MKVSPDGKAIEGCYAGHPNDWRTAQFVRVHTLEELAQIKAVTAAHHGGGHGQCSGHDH